MKKEKDIIDGNYVEIETVEGDMDKKLGMNINKKYEKNIYKKLFLMTIAGLIIYTGGSYVGNNYDILVKKKIENNPKDSKIEIALNLDENEIEALENNDGVSDLKTGTLIEVIKETVKSVVSIKVDVSSQFKFIESLGEGAGSGIIIKEDDDRVYILTNNHVIENATSASISLDDENFVKTKLLGRDAKNDIAILYIEKSNSNINAINGYKVATIKDDVNVELGMEVLAIGNAAGEGKSVTNGMVSALNKTLVKGGIQYIQTNAAINPGNSGGGLFDYEGNLIGINTAKLADTKIEGMGYSIPIDIALEISEEIINGIKNDENKKATLGIQGISMLDAFEKETLEFYNMPTEGVYVNEVIAGTGADIGGLRGGDVILEMDNIKIEVMSDLLKGLKGKEVGDEVSLKVFRKDRYVKVIVELGVTNSFK